MSEMIERVARATYEAMERLDPGDGRDWDALEEREREFHCFVAQDVIAAMRDPNKQMLDAGMTAADDALDSDYESDADGNMHGYSTLRSDAPADIFRAMIDAALTPDS